MIRLFGLGALALCLAGVLVGCGSGGDVSTDDVESWQQQGASDEVDTNPNSDDR